MVIHLLNRPAATVHYVESLRGNRSHDTENLVNRCCLQFQSGCRNDMDSPHGQRGAVRGKPEAFPHKPPIGGEPTMRKGSYSEELIKIDLHVENLLLPPRSSKEQ